MVPISEKQVKVRNYTDIGARIGAWRLYRRARFACRLWAIHLRRFVTGSSSSGGRCGALIGNLDEGTEPDDRQKLLLVGARQIDSTMAHLVQAYEAASRLLTFAGGDPLPWSSMVLARTAFEGSLRVLWLLAPEIEDEIRYARFAASVIETNVESVKLHTDLPSAIGGETLDKFVKQRREIEKWCASLSLDVSSGGRGRVRTANGETAIFPFNAVDTAQKWWDPVGVHTYRWLSSYTHGTQSSSPPHPERVAALRVTDAFFIYAIVTDATWTAMDRYAKWMGFPDGIVFRSMRRVRKQCAREFPNGLPSRPLSPEEEYLLAAADGFEGKFNLTKRAKRRFVNSFIRRVDQE